VLFIFLDFCDAVFFVCLVFFSVFFFVFVHCLMPNVAVSLDCPFLIAPFSFSNIYFCFICITLLLYIPGILKVYTKNKS
jgi:hypothetical protein